MNQSSHDRAYMTPNEVAVLLVVSPVTLRQWAQKGLIKFATTPGGHRRFLLKDVEQFARDRGISLASNGSLRVLVVDDNRSFTRYLADLLATLDKPIETLVAHDGFDAGRKVFQFLPNIILLDLKMPGMDGFEVCRLIKDDTETRHIRVIAMTGYYTSANQDKILNAGAEICLAKPFDKSDLLEAIGIDKSNGRSASVADGIASQVV